MSLLQDCYQSIHKYSTLFSKDVGHKFIICVFQHNKNVTKNVHPDTGGHYMLFINISHNSHVNPSS